MFKFAHPEYFYLFLTLPFWVALFLFSQWRARRRESTFGRRAVLKPLIGLRSTIRPVVKFCLLALALVLGIFLLARPQFGQNTGTEMRKGIEAIIAIDVSRSMMAEDVHPSRMERSKLLLSTLVERMHNDKVGLAIFAGEAYPQLPITNDYVSAKLFIDQLNTDLVSLQGTNLAAAIRLANRSFTQEKSVGKAIILITDGENHEPGAVEAAKEAADEGRHVYVLGVGSAEGAPIPDGDGFLTDREGKQVRTALNEAACREVAEAGNGIYIHVDGTNVAQSQLETALRQLQQKESGAVDDGSLDEQFQAVALLLLLVLVLELLLFEKQNAWVQRLRLFQK